MKPDRILKIIDDLEKELKVFFGIEAVVTTPFSSAGFSEYFFWFFERKTIYIPSGYRGRELREYLYHELGHALVNNYKLSNRMLKGFCSKISKDGWIEWWKYQWNVIKYSTKERKHGYVSGYASLDREEDFAETFSAFLLNDGKIGNGKIVYDGNKINLNATKERNLKNKFKTIKEIIKFCREQNTTIDYQCPDCGNDFEIESIKGMSLKGFSTECPYCNTALSLS